VRPASILGLALAGCGAQGAAAPDAGGVADMAAEIAMGAEVAATGDAAQDASKPSKKPLPCPNSAPPPACFHKCQPAPEVQFPVGPLPAKCAETTTGLIWDTPDGKAPGPPTLLFELGAGDVDTGAFVPYVEGQWAPIVEGVQGGIHVWAAARVKLPPGTPPKITLEIAGHSNLDCKPVATELAGTSKAIATADPSKPGWWTNARANVPGVPVAFEKNVAGPYCGQWIELVAEVRVPGTQNWGRGSVIVRLFDLDNL